MSPLVLPGGVGLVTELEQVLHTRGMVGSAQQALALNISLVRRVSSGLCLGMEMSPPLGRTFLCYLCTCGVPVKDTQLCHLLGVVLAHIGPLGIIPCPSETLELWDPCLSLALLPLQPGGV